jgi:hypothetical protein
VLSFRRSARLYAKLDTGSRPSVTIWGTGVGAMIFTDQNGNPLPLGTAIDLQPHSPHAGIIGYLPDGRQVVGHNSKQHGRAVVSWPQEFNSGMPIRIGRYPESHEHAIRIWQSVVSDVNRGVPWRGGDNCQDLVSRAYDGKNGSPTRDAIFGLLAVVALGVLAAKTLS